MSYKWKFKDVLTLSPTSSNYITIRSNGEVFSRINITDSQLLYGQFIVYEASSGWTNEAYKTIEMDNYPAGDLLQFLQSNAILLPSSNVNKVDLNGVTLLDLTSDTVTPETLLIGTTAHNAKGEIITGTLEAGGGGTEELFALLKVFGCSDYEISVVQEDTLYPNQRINIPITNETLKSSVRLILIPGTNSLFPANAIKKAPILRGPSMVPLKGFFAYIWPYYSNPYTTQGSIISMLYSRLGSFVYNEGSSFTQDGTVFVFANNTLTIHFNELSSYTGYSDYTFDNIIGTKVLLMGGNV